jgi:hypothetical protein
MLQNHSTVLLFQFPVNLEAMAGIVVEMVQPIAGQVRKKNEIIGQNSKELKWTR